MRRLILALLLLIPFLSPGAEAPPELIQKLSRADQLYYDGKYEEAARIYEELAEEGASNLMPKILLRLGQCYSKMGDLRRAHTYYSLAIDENPQSSFASQAVSFLATLYASRYQYDKAIEACRSIVDKYPSTPAAAVALYYAGNYLYLRGRKEEAAKVLEELVKKYPSSVYRESALSMLADIYVDKGRFDEAEAMLSSFLRGNPNNTDLARHLGEIYARQGKTEAALRILEMAHRINPNDTSVIEKLGEIYMLMGDRAKAIETWKRLLNVSTYGEPYRYQRLASVLKAHKLYDLALRYYREALKRQPFSAYIYSQIAEIYSIQGDIERAISTYAEAILKVGPGLGLREGMLEDMMEIVPEARREEALAEVEGKVREALSSNPSNPSYLQALAEVLFFKGDYGGALQILRRLAGVFVDQGEALRRYAQKLERMGKPLSAILYYREILNLFPRGRLAVEAALSAAEIYMEIGQPAKAEEVLNRLVSLGYCDPRVYTALGEAQLEGTGEVERALSNFRLAQAMSSGREAALAKLKAIECLIISGRFEEAKKELQELEGKAVPPGEVERMWGEWFFWQGMFEEAAARYRRAVERDPAGDAGRRSLERLSLIKLNSDYLYQPLTMFVEGMRYERTGEEVKALASYGMIINRFPDSAVVDEAKFRMALALQKLGNEGEAERFLSEIASSDSALAPRAQAYLADMIASKDPKRAIDEYSKLLDRFPKSAFAPYARERIRQLAKELPEL